MVEVYYQINDWILSVGENKLYREEREVSVEPRLINLLYFLAEHTDQVYGRDELIRYVWNEAVVTDQVVTQSIFELRKILRDGREKPLKYVATVPKRGYKLVAKVTPLSSEDFHHSRTPPPIADDIADDRSHEPERQSATVSLTFPAAPLSRAFHHSKNRIHPDKAKLEIGGWRNKIMDAALIVILMITISIFTYNQSEININEVIDTHLISFEFQDDTSSPGRSYELADGFTQKLMSDISQVGGFRVMLHKQPFKAGIIPGKAVQVRVEERDGNTFLELKYYDNASEKVLFSRQYSLTKKHFKSVLKQSSQDLMRLLHVPNAEHRAESLVAGLPTQAKAIELFIRAHHYLKVPDDQQLQHAIDLLEQVWQLEPNNIYVQSELLVACYMQKSMDEGGAPNQDTLSQLGRALSDHVHSTEMPIQPRVYEALSLHETMTGDQEQAASHLNQALRIRKSVLSYVLKGKHAELSGDLDSAMDAYSEAFYIDSSVETYLLCENLVFSSDLKQIVPAMYRAVHPRL